MNRIDIMALDAGRELDAAVDTEIFGNVHPGLNNELPHYSTDWGSVKAVVEKALEAEDILEIIMGADNYVLAGFRSVHSEKTKNENEVICDSLPEAICRAALLSKVGS